MTSEPPERVTIAEAARLLGVHPNTVRTRVKQGIYQADKVLTANGEAYMIPVTELQKDTLTPPSQSPVIIEQERSPEALLTIFKEMAQEAAAPLERQIADKDQRLTDQAVAYQQTLTEQAEEVGRLRQRAEAAERELARERARRRRWPWSRR